MSLFSKLANIASGGVLGMITDIAKGKDPMKTLMKGPLINLAQTLLGGKAKKGGRKPWGPKSNFSTLFEGMRMRSAAKNNPGLRNVSYGKGSYDLTDPQQLGKFMGDISDGKLDGFVDSRSGNVAKLRHGKVTLQSGTSYDLAKQGGLEAFMRDAKDGRIDGIVTRKPDRSLHVHCNVEQPNVRGRDHTSGSNVQRRDHTSANVRDRAEVVHHQHDHHHNVGTSGVGGTSGTSGVSGSGPSSYPSKNNIEGWTKFIKEHGYSAFMKAKDEGRVGKKVMKDKDFGLELQRAQMEENRFYTMMSNMMKSQHDLLSTIIRNSKV